MSLGVFTPARADTKALVLPGLRTSARFFLSLAVLTGRSATVYP